MNVVIIDNNFAIRQVLSIFIKELESKVNQNINLFTANDGVEGLGLIYAVDPDLVIIDTTLPKYSGREVLEYITTNDNISKSGTSIVILSEDGQDQQLSESYTVINKLESGFLDKILQITVKKASPSKDFSETKLPSLVAIGNTALKFANWTDLTTHALSTAKGYQKPALYMNWLGLEILTSLFLTFSILFYGQGKNEAIEQKQVDTLILRTKLLPVTGAFFAIVVLLATNILLNISFQSLLLRDSTQPSAAAATFTVDSTADTTDFSAGDGVCDTDDSVGDGPCTLRAAIEEANALAGADTVEFNLSGSAPFIIVPTNDLPDITEELHIDGYSQAGSTPNSQAAPAALDGSIAIELDASNYTVELGALHFDTAHDSSVTGLAIYGFQNNGISISDSDNVVVSGNYIGTDSTGLAALPITGTNVQVSLSSSDIQIGGTTPAERNVLVNADYGIYGRSLLADSIDVYGNIIGLGRDGSTVLANATGILFDAIDNIEIGTTNAGNIISGNTGAGIWLRYADSSSILNNYVGVDSTGLINKGNGSYGVYIFRSNSFNLGNSGGGNIISDNIDEGIFISGGDNLSIVGNTVGLAVDGSTPIGNSNDGIFIEDATNVTIGGSGTNAGNTISANTANGVEIDNTPGTQIIGNIIGLDDGGTIDLGNTNYGLNIINSSDNTIIGGDQPGEGNIISGNFKGAIIDNSYSPIIEGNKVGTDITGTVDLGNDQNGIELSSYSGAIDAQIGGTSGVTLDGSCTGACNLISGNNWHGVYANDDSMTNLTVEGNFIGTDINGSFDLGNNSSGVFSDGLGNVIIGGDPTSSPNSRNVLAGSNSFGDVIIHTSGSGRSADNITIQGNYIGVDSDATDAITSTNSILIYHAFGSFINNTLVDQNILGGSNNSSIYFSGDGIDGAIATNNTVGLQADGVTPLNNARARLSLYVDAATNVVATDNKFHYSISSGDGIYIRSGNNGVYSNNIISGQDENGIYIRSNATGNVFSNNQIFSNNGSGIVAGRSGGINGVVDNVFSQNIIYDNAEIGIDLAEDLVTLNDPGDIDTGLLNFPTLNSVNYQDGTTAFDFNLDTNSGEYLVEFYENSTANTSGYGEGEIFLCSDTITHTGSGDESFEVSCNTSPTANSPVTAIAIFDSGGGSLVDTSEFSPNNVLANLAIVTNPDSSTIPEGQETIIDVLANDTDPNGGTDIDETTLSIISAPINGDAIVVPGKLQYDPDPSFVGNDSITYSICDFGGLCTEETLSITVSASPTNTPTPTDTPKPSAITESPTNLPTQSPIPTSNRLQTSLAPSITNTATPTLTATVIQPSTTQPIPTPTSLPIPEPSDTPVEPIDPNLLLGYGEEEIDATLKPTSTPTPIETSSNEGSESDQSVLSAITDLVEENELPATGIGALIVSTPIIVTSISAPGVSLYAMLWFISLKRKRPWGLVYDTTTNTPIPFATIYAEIEGKRKASSVSNLDGKYQIYPSPGRYDLTIKHPRYKAQAKSIIVGQDGPQEFIEFGLVPENSPSPTTWANIINYIKNNLAKINKGLFSAAFIYSLVVTIISPTIFNLLILLIFFIQISIAILIIRGMEPKWGQVTDRQTNTVVIREFIRLINGEKQVDVTLTNDMGGYGFIATPGIYKLKVDEHQILDGETMRSEIQHTIEAEETVNFDLKVSKKPEPSPSRA